MNITNICIYNVICASIKRNQRVFYRSFCIKFVIVYFFRFHKSADDDFDRTVEANYSTKTFTYEYNTYFKLYCTRINNSIEEFILTDCNRLV